MNKNWTKDEIILALEYYEKCPENMHTDSHAMCKEVAGQIGRTEGALDQILRNIKHADTNEAGLPNASALIHETVAEYADKKDKLCADAAAIRKSRGLPPLPC